MSSHSTVLDGRESRIGLLTLPRELRDLILSLVLTGSPLLITQWTCSRSAVAHIHSLRTKVASVEHETSASASLDFFARSALLHVNRQLRQEGAEVLRTVGYKVYVVSHTSQIQSMMTTSKAILHSIDAICLTNACRCTGNLDVGDRPHIYDEKYALQRDEILSKMPRLRHLYLSAFTTLARLEYDMMGLHTAFIDCLETGRLQRIYVECGTDSAGTYAADVDYERAWSLGPPRMPNSRDPASAEILLQEVDRRRKLKQWLAFLSADGVARRRWPLPQTTRSSLRFIIQKGPCYDIHQG